MKSVLGYFEAFSEMGVNVNLKAFEEFDFSKTDYNGQTIILAHQISIPDDYAPLLENFVTRGGKLLADGLTGFFDENLHNTMKTGFAFEKLLGGNISEFKLVDNLFTTTVEGNKLPTHLWRGFIVPSKGQTIAATEGKTIALRNTIGQGEVIWIPSLLGLGSRIRQDYSDLNLFLKKEFQDQLSAVPIRFSSTQKNVLMKTMESDNSLVTVIINKAATEKAIELIVKNPGLHPTILFSNLQGSISGKILKIKPEETMVVKWTQRRSGSSEST
jgi:beta-galactosidase